MNDEPEQETQAEPARPRTSTAAGEAQPESTSGYGPVGTKVVFDNDQVRVWVLRLAPGERSAVHKHDLDHLLIQIRGDRIAVAPEPEAQGPHRDYMEAPVIPGMVAHVPKGGIETAINVGDEDYYEIIVELKD